MATYLGDNAEFRWIKGTTGTPARVWLIKELSFTQSGDEIDVTAMGDEGRVFAAGQTETEITISAHFEDLAAVGQAAIAVGDIGKFELLPTGSGTGVPIFSGSATVIERSVTAAREEPNEISWRLKAEGAMTRTSGDRTAGTLPSGAARKLGNSGVIKFTPDGGSEGTLGELLNFSFTESGSEIEDTVMGDSGKSYKAGAQETSLSITCRFDAGDTSQNALTVATQGYVEVRPEGTGSGLPEFTGDVTVSSHGMTASIGEIIERTYELKVNGVLELGAITPPSYTAASYSKAYQEAAYAGAYADTYSGEYLVTYSGPAT